jgi:hypothetical protein
MDGESENGDGTSDALSDWEPSELLSLLIFLCSSKESKSP